MQFPYISISYAFSLYIYSVFIIVCKIGRPVWDATHVFHKMAASMKPKADHNFDKKISKRKINEHDSKTDSGPEAKQKKNESMTEVEFKFLLRDPKTILSGKNYC